MYAALLQATLSLVDDKVQMLFELWDRDGDGSVAFADVALAFRKFSPATQRLQSTAADAAEVCLFIKLSMQQCVMLVHVLSLVGEPMASSVVSCV